MMPVFGPMRFGMTLAIVIAALSSPARFAAADEDTTRQLVAALSKLEPNVLSNDARKVAARQMQSDLNDRLRAANATSSAKWRRISNRADWESFRLAKLESLRKSLGEFPEQDEQVVRHVTNTLEGDGYVIDNLLYLSRPGVWVSANLYRPTDGNVVAGKQPGIILCHSHHTPKTHGELQDMGMTWARLGCVVLIPDHVGHGERRQHPFVTERDFTGSFRPSRQDYYFRYDLGLQLDMAGQSLVGQIVFDLSRGVDLLLSMPSVDPNRIMLLGAVAGGGDPAAIAAALDSRISAAAPFNFGGPQPETRYPLPEDAETTFHYAGSGGWESTRNLRRSAADGFLPWVIVGGIAPRRLIYGHEFRWDRERDPVWKRLQTIFGWYNSSSDLSFTHGHGELRGQPPEASHCTHIGAVHRKRIHSAFSDWFQMPDATDREFSQRRSSEELLCWTPALRERLRPAPLRDVLSTESDARVKWMRAEWDRLDVEQSRIDLRRRWRRLLTTPDSNASSGSASDRETDGQLPVAPRIASLKSETLVIGNLSDQAKAWEVLVTRAALEAQRGISVPTLLLVPKRPDTKRSPVVLCIAQGGKERFLRERAEALAELLSEGVAVCMPDLWGTGETTANSGRDRSSAATAYSSSQQMLGGTILGEQLLNLRSVIRFVRTSPGIDETRIAIWGDSFAKTNEPKSVLEFPHGIEKRPAAGEPMGGLLALFGALYEPEIRSVYVRGGLASFGSVFQSSCVYIPHDAVIPGALTVSEVSDIVAALAPLPVRFDELIDSSNRLVANETVKTEFAPALDRYGRMSSESNIDFGVGGGSPAAWLLKTFAR